MVAMTPVEIVASVGCRCHFALREPLSVVDRQPHIPRPVGRAPTGKQWAQKFFQQPAHRIKTKHFACHEFRFGQCQRANRSSAPAERRWPTGKRPFPLNYRDRLIDARYPRHTPGRQESGKRRWLSEASPGIRTRADRLATLQFGEMRISTCVRKKEKAAAISPRSPRRLSDCFDLWFFLGACSAVEDLLRFLLKI